MKIVKKSIFRKIMKLIRTKNAVLFIKYNLFAGISTLLDLILIYILTEFFGVWYIYSVTLGYMAGVSLNYILNKYLNFKNKSRKIVLQFGLFISIALVGLLLNQIIIYILVESLGIWYIFAKIIAVLLVMFWNFTRHKKWTFRIFK